MGLNLTNVYQKPYVVRDGRNLVKKKQDEEQSAGKAVQEEEAGSQSKSRGLQYVEQQPRYTPAYERMQAESQRAQTLYGQGGGVSNIKSAEISSSIEHRSSKINIAQIIKDFKNTAVAIGTPPELSQEVNDRLALIQAQVSKGNPDAAIVKSDLKNASKLLDNYISQTLNKESKVVENWVSALFLQQIDFNYNEGQINPQFLVKFPEGSTEQAEKTQTKSVPESEMSEPAAVVESTKVYIPQDKELKSLFLQSKKLAYANEPKKAIETFQKALERANEIGDKETEAKVFFEVGKIYDNHDYYAQALKSFNKAIEGTSDYNIKTKAHYSMGQIYDEVNQIQPALDHYYSSAAYGGESENLAAQSTSLTRMGNIYVDMYEQNAFDFLSTANEIAQETDNSKVKGFVSSSLAKAYDKFGEPQEALKSYSKAVKYYADAESPQKVAQNYMDAAEIMLDYNSPQKAKGLLEKAQKFARQTDNVNLMNEINAKIETLVV